MAVAMHSCEEFRTAYSQGDLKVVFSNNFSIGEWAKEQGLKPPLFGRHQWIVSMMLSSEERFEQIYSHCDVHRI